MKNRTRSRVFSAFALVALSTAWSLPALAQTSEDSSTSAALRDDKQAAADLNVARSLSRAFNRAAEAVEPSVVHITQFRDVAVRRNFFDVQTQPMAVGAGSGVIVSSDGYILTNNHVIEGASAVKVILADGRKLDGTVVGTDPATDLGVVRVDATGLKAAQWGKDEDLAVGEWVLAIGSPFGQFDNTVTSGIISAKHRITDLGNPTDERYEDFIQTDAAINPGNSGGPLVNLEGKIVGINSQIATRSGGNVGIGFSIPASIARPVMEMIMKNHGRVDRGWIGIGMANATAGEQKGVLLARVFPGGPAGNAGLKPDDVIVGFNGRKIDSTNSLRNAIAFTAPGSDAEVEVMRAGELVKATLHIVNSTQGRAMLPGGKALDRYGFSVDDLPRSVANQLGADGVIVNYVSRVGAAAESGVQVEDIILRANGTSVADTANFDKVMNNLHANRLRLDVYRPSTGQRGYINVDVDPNARTAD